MQSRPDQSTRSFEKMERLGWSDVVLTTGYIENLSPASDQAIPALLGSAQAKPGMKVLDLCCGQGNVSRALVEIGCDAFGADFSSVMLAHARKRAPIATFIEANAQKLPFGKSTFDAVVSNFGICHVPDPSRALQEAKRVLRPGGHLALTVWCGPEISPGFECLYHALQSAGDPAIAAPPGPDFHQFARDTSAIPLLIDAGFSGVTVQVVECFLSLGHPGKLFDIFQNGTIRAAAILASQSTHHLEAIRLALLTSVRSRFKAGEHWRVAIPAALVSATS